MITTYHLRSKLADITYFLVHVISYLIILIFIVILELFIFYLGSSYLSGVNSIYIAVIVTVLIVIGYSSLRNTIANFAGRTFLRALYDPAELSSQLNAIMANELNIGFLEKKIADILIAKLSVSSAFFVLVSDFNARPIQSLDTEASAANRFASLEKMLHHVKKIMVFEELSDPVDKQTFASLGIAVIVPLAVGDEDIGLLILGPKTSKKIYTSRDLKFLKSIAPSVSLAIKNAEGYRKIQDFSRTLETKIIERTHQLEESQAKELKLKDEFVFIATHDLATPVTAISGFAQLINSRQEKISDQLKSDLVAINAAAGRLKVLVNDLLQVARSESGTVKIDLVDVDVSKLIDAAITEVSLLAKDRNIKILRTLGPDNTVKADPTKLLEVIENIVSNAVKYNRDGGTLAISSLIKDDGIVFEFKDNGFGIPAAEQNKVFTKFFRSESPQARTHPGTGLGLFVARMLTEKMGGKITFTSVENAGTTFYLFFKR